METLTTIERYGLPIAVLAFLAITWSKQIWPFITTQISTYQIERTHERDAFLASLTALENAATAAHLAAAANTVTLALQMESLAVAVHQTAVLIQQHYDALKSQDEPK